MADKKIFTRELFRWNKYDNTRVMPWKYEKDPYKIWISEIILQQTRVQQGLEYYTKFISKYPSVQHLAKADEGEVFKLWEGLGYYSRCKNIIASAKFIVANSGGKFPDEYEKILQLKGVGSYTASAIASFAYNLPYAVLDGNVFRVLSRYFGTKTPIDTPEGKKYYSALANDLLDKKNAGLYNQCIMDFGATVCKPLPLCEVCPLQIKCIAFQKNIVRELPVKEKFIVKRKRWFYYLVITYKNKFYVRKRAGKDIWQNLYEFVLIEMPKASSINKLQRAEKFTSILFNTKFNIEGISGLYRQQLTHQTIYGQFINITLNSPLINTDYQLLSSEKLGQLPFPKFINTYLKD